MSEKEKDEWVVLKNPPVVVALFQIRFDQKEIDLSKVLDYDTPIKSIFPNREDTVRASIDVPGTIALGISKITGTSSAEIHGYVYSSEDKKSKLTIEKGSIAYQDEHPYKGWDEFKNNIIIYLKLLSPLLDNHTIQRVSIRFINKLSFDEFDDPTEYFKTMVSTTKDDGFLYPMSRCSFRLAFDVPNTERYIILNQDLDNQSSDKYDYMFDIDVLDRTEFQFSRDKVLEITDELRKIKNEMFFNNITQKTIDLCN